MKVVVVEVAASDEVLGRHLRASILAHLHRHQGVKLDIRHLGLLVEAEAEAEFEAGVEVEVEVEGHFGRLARSKDLRLPHRQGLMEGDQMAADSAGASNPVLCPVCISTCGQHTCRWSVVKREAVSMTKLKTGLRCRIPQSVYWQCRSSIEDCTYQGPV
jgi:hypothetical protein